MPRWKFCVLNGASDSSPRLRRPDCSTKSRKSERCLCRAPRQSDDGVLILNIIAATVLIAGTYALSERKYLFPIAIVLSGISIIATGLLLAFPRHSAVVVSHTSVIILVSFFSVTIFGYVLRSGRITADMIFAAVCVSKRQKRLVFVSNPHRGDDPEPPFKLKPGRPH